MDKYTKDLEQQLNNIKAQMEILTARYQDALLSLHESKVEVYRALGRKKELEAAQRKLEALKKKRADRKENAPNLKAKIIEARKDKASDSLRRWKKKTAPKKTTQKPPSKSHSKTKNVRGSQRPGSKRGKGKDTPKSGAHRKSISNELASVTKGKVIMKGRVRAEPTPL